MYKLQNMKGKTARAAIATVMTVAIASLCFAPVAFAEEFTSEGETEVSVWQSQEPDPGDISVTFPVAIKAAIYKDTNNLGKEDPDLIYETVSYLANESLTEDVKVKSITVDEVDFDVISKPAFQQLGTVTKHTLWTTLGGKHEDFDASLTEVDLGNRDDTTNILEPGWVLAKGNDTTKKLIQYPLNFKGGVKTNGVLANDDLIPAYNVQWVFSVERAG